MYKKRPFKYKKVIPKLPKNSNIIVLKQDKGRGVVIMNRTKYLHKCYTILDSNQFTKRDQNPTWYVENKVQRTPRKVKFMMPHLFIQSFICWVHVQVNFMGQLQCINFQTIMFMTCHSSLSHQLQQQQHIRLQNI